MTDEQIIKALECSPLNDIGGCRKIDALDLINRQKAEIERLNKIHSEQISKLNADTKELIKIYQLEAKKELAREILSLFDGRMYLSKNDTIQILDRMGKILSTIL